MALDLRTRLERALQLELPGAEICDSIRDALLKAHEEHAGDAESQDGLMDMWFPLLIPLVPNQVDDEAVRAICCGVLRRLSEAEAPDRPAEAAAIVPGLLEILTEAAIAIVPGRSCCDCAQALLEYDERARRWCEENSITSLDELAERSEAFCGALAMKNLQIRRFQKALASRERKVVIEMAVTGEISAFGFPDDMYTITRLLGTGATARVYECRRGSCVFAAKVITLTTMKLQPSFQVQLAKLRREMDILRTLKHERIVSLYATLETDDYMILVMEMVPGGDLFGHVVGLSEDDARCVFLQLVDALSYIHGQRVVHRDLKLENILVSSLPPNGKLEVKVADFGTSKLIKEGMSTALSVVGTQQYWAPEVALLPSASGYDFSVDLWSLGVVLYLMLEGRYPFIGPQMADQIRMGDLQFGPESRASEDARDLVRRLIQVEHRRRISLSGCLEHAWCAKRASGASAGPAGVPAAAPPSTGGRKGVRGKQSGVT